jgi:DNA-binding ferritin-like protein
MIAKLQAFKEITLKNIDAFIAVNDQTSANILCEIMEKIDQHLFLLRAPD